MLTTQKNVSRTWATFLIGLFTIVTVIALWELISRVGLYNPLLFPPPSRIAAAFSEMVESGEWAKDLGASLSRYGTGFVLGCLLGILLGMLTGRIQLLRDSFSPLLNFLRSTPSVALIPLAIVWFGIGESQKIFIVTWSVTFPLWLNTHAGVSEVEREYVWAAQSLGAKGWRLFQKCMCQAPYHLLSPVPAWESRQASSVLLLRKWLELSVVSHSAFSIHINFFELTR